MRYRHKVGANMDKNAYSEYNQQFFRDVFTHSTACETHIQFFYIGSRLS